MNKSKFSTKPYVQKVNKPWGHELILTPEESPATGKIIHLNQKARFSLQYHEKKQETLVLLTGEALIILEDAKGVLQKIKMEPLKGYFIRPFQQHRCQGITDCDILEASTREEGKTVRLQDDYGRGTETEEARKERTEDKIYMG